MSFTFLLVFLLSTFLSYRATAFVTVKSVKADKDSVILKLSEAEEVSVGSTLEYKDPNGNSCVVKVKKISNMMALAEATMCDDINVLKPGKMLELTDGGAGGSSSSIDDSDRSGSRERGNRGGRDHRHRRGGLTGTKGSVRLYYSTATEIYSSFKAFGTEFKSVIKTPGALGIGLNASYFSESSIMFSLGLSYELERKLNATKNSDGSEAKFTDGEGIAFAIVDLNFGYVFKNSGVIFLGVNMPSPMLTNMEDAKMGGAMGYQAGLIYLSSSNLSFDLSLRYLNLTMPESTTKYDVIQFDGACLGFGYIF
jgi:hypothetical protein